MNNLQKDIKRCLEKFVVKYGISERNQKQSKAALDLANVKNKSNSDDDICVLQGPAGCGKTKISLEWAYNTNANKIIWVCPRVQVCMSIFEELSSSEYLDNSRIEILTGEDKRIYQSGQVSETEDDEKFSGDIVITTIDQILNKITTHRDVDSLIEFMESHVIFDEFHELININPHNVLFMELIEVKRSLEKNSNTLLLSATPNYLFCKEILDICDSNIVKIDTFNSSKYKIILKEYNDDEVNPMILNTFEDNSIVIFNTAKDAQFSFIKNQEKENSILFHSKLSSKDRKDIFKKIFDSFKKDGNKNYDILRSGPLVEASLNITCDKMYTQIHSAEHILQRIGRLDRFGNNDFVNELVIFIPNSLTKDQLKTNEARFLNSLNEKKSACAFYKFLEKNDIIGKEISLTDLYNLYEDLYEDNDSKNDIMQDIMKSLNDSAEKADNLLDAPIGVHFKKSNKKSTKKISKKSLRGENYFINMSKRKCDSNMNLFDTGEYAVQLPEYCEGFYDEESFNDDFLTENPKDEWDEWLEVMFNKHHNIFKSYKKCFTKKIMKNEGRSLDTPLFLSYSDEHLARVNVNENVESCSYYIITEKQPVGIINLKNFKEKKAKYNEN